jgi:hypothetical protein
MVIGANRSRAPACYPLGAGLPLAGLAVEADERSPKVKAAPPEDLPPRDLPSPYELYRAKKALWSARVALQAVHDKIEKALVAVENAESRVTGR